jgi:carbon storage regulator
MLVLTRRQGERLFIGDDIVVTICRVGGDQVRIGFTAPNNIPVYRKEIYERIKNESRSGVASRNPIDRGSSKINDEPDSGGMSSSADERANGG